MAHPFAAEAYILEVVLALAEVFAYPVQVELEAGIEDLDAFLHLGSHTEEVVAQVHRILAVEVLTLAAAAFTSLVVVQSLQVIEAEGPMRSLAVAYRREEALELAAD